MSIQWVLGTLPDTVERQQEQYRTMLSPLIHSKASELDKVVVAAIIGDVFGDANSCLNKLVNDHFDGRIRLDDFESFAKQDLLTVQRGFPDR